MFSLFWGGVIITLPLYLKIGNAVPRFSKDLFFFFAVVTSIALFGINKISLNTKLLLAAIVVSAFFGIYDFTHWKSLWQLFGCLAGVLCLSQFLSIEIDKKLITKFLAISCLIQSVFIIFNHFGISLYSEMIQFVTGATRGDNNGNYHIVGTLGNANIAGAYVALTLPFLISGSLAILAPLAIFAIVASKSLMAVATCAFILLYSLFKLHSLSIMFLAGLVAYFFYPQVLSGRIPIWEGAINNLSTSGYFIGEGLGAFAIKSGNGLNQTHNDYLDMVYAFGVPLTLITVAYVLNKILKTKEHDAFFYSTIAFMFNALGNFPMHISNLGLIGIISLSQVIKQGSKDESILEW